MKPVIAVENLKKSFAKNEVLKSISFAVNQGEIFALLGSNGAGKTTAINIMSTLLNADAGSVLVGDYNVASQPEKVRSIISLTGQFVAVDDILTARENLELIADLRHQPDSRRIATDLLKKFGLTKASDQRVATFSGGMRRRLDIAMSLIGTPKIIFLDEPTTGLDPEARLAMWQTIKLLAKSGITIFLTTQHLDEAEQLADHIAILHSGHIIANGSFEDLKKLLPPTKKEWVEKQPTLEEIFLAITKQEAK